MYEEIMEEVSGCCLPFVSGRLKGFGRRKVKGEHYPAIFPDDKSEVAGILYLNVPPLAWLSLDSFEGEMYRRRAVQIELDIGDELPAETYVIEPGFQNVLEAFDWDYDSFLRFEKESFRRHYQGYRSLEAAHSRGTVK